MSTEYVAIVGGGAIAVTAFGNWLMAQHAEVLALVEAALHTMFGC